MQATRTVLLIKKIYENEFTWLDLENYFNINRDCLKDELKKFFDNSGNGFSMVINKVNSNEKNMCKLEE